jgi:hypothetical protein
VVLKQSKIGEQMDVNVFGCNRLVSAAMRLETTPPPNDKNSYQEHQKVHN